MQAFVNAYFRICVRIVGCCLLFSALANRTSAQQLAFRLRTPSDEIVSIENSSSKLTAVCFLGTECPMARAYVTTLNELQRDFQEQLRIVAVMSNLQDSTEDVREYIASTDAKFSVVMDPGNRVADQYGATRTPEVFLLDAELKLRYHGRIDDQYAPSVARAEPRREDLKIAVQELLAGKPVTVKETKAVGCIIGKAKHAETDGALQDLSSPSLTFAQHVYPILQEHCMECHRSGEIGPFSMEVYDEVLGWADTMMEAIDDGRMPPWHADPAYGSFANERHMPREDRELLRSWIANGAPAGDLQSLPAPKQFAAGWQFGREPDLVLAMRDRPFVIPRDGVVEYQYFVVDPGFEQDRWLISAQVIPGSRDVVHHAIVFVRPPDGSAMPGVGWLTAYVPGQRTLEPPPGHARRIPAGSKLVFQMHYTPNGTPREDVSRVGLIFADDADVTHELITLAALEQEFEIPPGAEAHTVRARLPRIPADGQLLAVTPHMHYRGKAFELVATYKDRDAAEPTRQETLLSVPNYDFNWQHSYLFQQPIALDTIKQLACNVVFDNSAGNIFNPDPTEWVTWGDQTWEEMALAFFEVSIPRQTSSQRPRGSAAESQSASKSDQKINAYVEQVFRRLDANQDGVIQKSEGSIVVRHVNFDRWDLDGDGQATQSEVRSVAERIFQ